MYQPLVEIKTPCHESLENREPGGKGNYCKTCHITVVDFTGMNPEEISQYLRNNDVHCGTFNRKDTNIGSRLNRLVSYLQTNHLKFAAVILLSFILMMSCRVRRGKVAQANVPLSDKKEPSVEHLK